MKIRIIGACGSGKSFIARELSNRLDIKNIELDNFVWERGVVEDTRYPKEIRDAKLREAVDQESWVIEGVYYKWGLESFRHADYIFILYPWPLIRDYRVIKRFVRTRLGLEQWNYKQSFKNLIQMLIWNRKFDRVHLKNIMEITESYTDKRYLIRDNKEIFKHIYKGT